MRTRRVFLVVAVWILACSSAFSVSEYDELMKAARENAGRYIQECNGTRSRKIVWNDKMIEKAMDDYRKDRDFVDSPRESKVPDAVKWLLANGNLSLPNYITQVAPTVEGFLAATGTEGDLWVFTDKVLNAEPNRRTRYSQEEFNSKLEQIAGVRDSIQNKVDDAIANQESQKKQEMDDLLNNIDALKGKTCQIYENVIACMESRRDNESGSYQSLLTGRSNQSDYSGINYHKTVMDSLDQAIGEVKSEMGQRPDCASQMTQGNGDIQGLHAELKSLRREQALQNQRNQLQNQRQQQQDSDYGERLTRQAQAEYGPVMRESQEMMEKVKNMPGSGGVESNKEMGKSQQKQWNGGRNQGSDPSQSPTGTVPLKSDLEKAMGY